MRKLYGHRIVVVAAILHLFAEAGIAEGLIVCVGADEHRAVEQEHAINGCSEANGATEQGRAESLELAGSGDCSDTILVSRCTELLSHAPDGSEAGPAAILISAAPGPSTSFGLISRPLLTSSGSSSGLESLRSVVLVL
jgi:hypothetical protein